MRYVDLFWVRDFEAIASAATPGPWRVAATEKDVYNVVGEGMPIEMALPLSFASYLVFLRTISSRLLEAAQGCRALRKSVVTTLSTETDAALASVRAEWVFVAPQASDAFFLHNCVQKVGAGCLSRENALFIDAAKQTIPRLLTTLSSPPSVPPIPEPNARTVFIPRRARQADVSAEYRGFAGPDQSLHSLSGRHDVAERTRAMVTAILDRLQVQRGHRVLDVGCGDATLLRQISGIAARCVGTVLTDAERVRLLREAGLKDITIITASFDDLDALPGPFDRIVVNGCIHFVRSRTQAECALRSILALMSPKAKAWIGELHARDSRPRVFPSKRAAVRHVRETYGNAFAFAFVRYLWRRRHRADVVIEPPPADWWHVAPDAFVAMAEHCGFHIEGLWTCLELTGDTFYGLQERYSCLLTKP